MYIVCFVVLLLSVILAVSCSSSKKKRKKNIVALTQYSRARFSSLHTHTFRLQKIKVSRAKIFKKNSPSPRRFAPSLPFVDRSLSLLLPPKHLSFPTDPALGNPAESKGKRTVTFSSSAPPWSHRRRWGHTFDVVLV